MLFNKSTGMPKPDVLSTASLIAWLEGKVADHTHTYRYMNNRHCLLAQYFEDHGFKGVMVMPDCYTHRGRMPVIGWKALPKGWGYVAMGDADEFDWTFGRALERAKTLEVSDLSVREDGK